MVNYNYAAQQLIHAPPDIKVWLHAIVFVSHWNHQAHQQLKAKFMTLFLVQNGAHFNLLLSTQFQSTIIHVGSIQLISLLHLTI